MSGWEDFKRLDTLRVHFRENSSAKNAEIFGNSNNQVAVTIQVKIIGTVDEKETVLHFTEAELAEQISLVRYSDGSAISSPWGSSAVSKGYDAAYQFSNVRSESLIDADGDMSYVTLYVSSSVSSVEDDFAVQIYVPGVGVFNTTRDGTGTDNDNSQFKSPSLVHILAIKPIDYSSGVDFLKTNNMPSAGSHSQLDEKISDVWVNGLNKNVGIASTKEVTIVSSANKCYFKSITTNGGKVKQSWNFPGNGFADCVYGAPGDNYDTIFLFINKKEFGFLRNNIIYLVKGNTTVNRYTVGERDDRFHWSSSVPTDKIKVNICNHRVPKKNYHQLNWHDEVEQSVTVTDNYGNTSVIKIKLDSGTWPGFRINGEKVN